MEKIVIDAAELTLGDLEDFEKVSGATYAELTKLKSGENPPLNVLIGLIYVFGRKHNPEMTLDDVRNVNLGKLEIEVKDSGTNPPIGDS